MLVVSAIGELLLAWVKGTARLIVGFLGETANRLSVFIFRINKKVIKKIEN